MHSAERSVYIRVCVDYVPQGRFYWRAMWCLRLTGEDVLLMRITECPTVVTVNLSFFFLAAFFRFLNHPTSMSKHHPWSPEQKQDWVEGGRRGGVCVGGESICVTQRAREKQMERRRQRSLLVSPPNQFFICVCVEEPSSAAAEEARRR